MKEGPKRQFLNEETPKGFVEKRLPGFGRYILKI